MKKSFSKRHLPLRAAASAAIRPSRRRSGFVMEEAEPRRMLVALSALPILHSQPLATAKLFIDFDGSPAIGNWLGFDVPAIPAYDQDGNANDYSNAELDDIREIWARVAEYFSPFNIDVTTQDPGNRANNFTSQIILGGSVDDWFKEPAGGVAPLGAFFNGAPNIGFVFAADTGNVNYLGLATAHEAGHTFGLFHHSVFDENGQLVEEYDPGTPEKAPIMGFGPSSTRHIWSNTIADIGGDPVPQDDLAILSGFANGFGYRVDDWGNSRLSGTDLTPVSGNATVNGVIERNTDVDAFNFVAGTGTVNINVFGAQYTSMLDATVRVVDPFGTVIAQAANPSLGESLSVNVQAGRYTILVSGAGQYGDLGQYTLDVDIPIGGGQSDHFLVEGTDFDDVITIDLVNDAYELVVNGESRVIDPNTIKFFDILTGEGNDTVTIAPGVCSSYVLGGSGNDTLTGGGNKDILSGSAGNDVIFGGDGDDRVAGGAGRDILVGGLGVDRLYGDAGNDVITGGAGVDRLYGGDDNDVLNGQSSADKIYGQAGNDSIYGQAGTDLLNGGDGLDQIFGGDDDDTIYTRDINFDTINGGSGFDKAETEDQDTKIQVEELLT